MKRILIAEDEDVIRDFIVINLKRAGYEVVDVPDGEQALQVFEQSGGDFDVVVLDIMMPGIDGFGVCEKIRAASNAIGIIMLSAKSQEMDKVREQLGTDFCRRCNYCAPCTVGINIPSVFLFAGYLQRYDLADWAKDRYSTLKVKASACIGCGKCEPRCPYHLPIREKLKKCARDMGE